IQAIGPGQSFAQVLNPSNSLISNHPSVYIAAQAFSIPTAEGTIDLSLSGSGVSLTNWRMYAVTYPAGSGARPYTQYDVTSGRALTTTVHHNRALVGTTNRFTFGNTSNTIPGNSYQPADVAAGGFTTQPLTLAQLQSIRSWLLGPEGLRGVTGF